MLVWFIAWTRIINSILPLSRISVNSLTCLYDSRSVWLALAPIFGLKLRLRFRLHITMMLGCILRVTLLNQLFMSILLMFQTDRCYALLNNPVIQNLDVTRYSIDDDGILVTFTDPARDFSTGSWSDLGNDIFRVGISFQGNQLGHNRPRLTEGVERLICTNMTYMMMRRHSYALNVKRRSLDVLLEERFGTWSQNNTIINLVNDRVNLLKNTSASYLEVETVFYSLASLIDDSECALVP